MQSLPAMMAAAAGALSSASPSSPDRWAADLFIFLIFLVPRKLVYCPVGCVTPSARFLLASQMNACVVLIGWSLSNETTRAGADWGVTRVFAPL